jgi:non-heme chloroperoxidase
MHYIEVGRENSGSIEIHYEDHGSGQPVVLIHGFPLSGRAWEKQVRVLLDWGFRTIAYDRRGFGYSSQPATGYDYDTLAADLDKIMTRLDLQETILVGHSMGTGEVARYLSTYGSQRVSKAIFIAPIPPFLLKTADNPDGIEESVFDGFKQAILRDRPAFLTQFFQDFYNVDQTLGHQLSEEVLQDGWRIGVGASAIGTHDCVTAWTTDFRKDLPSIDVPSLIIQGDADRVLPVDLTGKRMHEAVEGSRLVVLEGAPHGLTWINADEVNWAMMDFICGGAQMRVA